MQEERGNRQGRSRQRGPQTDKQKYSRYSGERVKNGWSNRGTREGHYRMKYESNTRNNSEQKKANPRCAEGKC